MRTAEVITFQWSADPIWMLEILNWNGDEFPISGDMLTTIKKDK